MRWIVLAFFAALPAIASPAPARDGAAAPGHVSHAARNAVDYVLDAAPLSEAVAVVPPGVLRLERTPVHGAGVRQPGPAAAAQQTASESTSAAARARWRMLDLASLDFTARLAFSLHGSVSSHSTACPPPA